MEFNSGYDIDRDIIAYGKYPTEKRSGGWIFGSHILTHAELGQQGYIQLVAECERRKYSSQSYKDSYINSYSKYSENSDHSVCLTKSSRNERSERSERTERSDSSKSENRSKLSSSTNLRSLSSSSIFSGVSVSSESLAESLAESLDELNKVLSTCGCGSGLKPSLCKCSSNSIFFTDKN